MLCLKVAIICGAQCGRCDRGADACRIPRGRSNQWRSTPYSKTLGLRNASNNNDDAWEPVREKIELLDCYKQSTALLLLMSVCKGWCVVSGVMKQREGERGMAVSRRTRNLRVFVASKRAANSTTAGPPSSSPSSRRPLSQEDSVRALALHAPSQ